MALAMMNYTTKKKLSEKLNRQDMTLDILQIIWTKTPFWGWFIPPPSIEQSSPADAFLIAEECLHFHILGNLYFNTYFTAAFVNNNLSMMPMQLFSSTYVYLNVHMRFPQFYFFSLAFASFNIFD